MVICYEKEKMKGIGNIRHWLLVTIISLLFPSGVWAQVWTAQDSLHLKRLLEDERELELNPEAVKAIDLGGANETPHVYEGKQWLYFDETLPSVSTTPKKIIYTLMPYTPTTPHDWDPILQRKIRREEYGKPLKLSMEKMESLSVKNVKGMHYYMFRERANGTMIHSMAIDNSIPVGKNGAYVNAGIVGGLDLMRVFTKDFWDFKGRETRRNTQNVLNFYNSP